MGVYDFSIVTDGIHWGINYCFGNKSKSIPHTDSGILFPGQRVKQVTLTLDQKECQENSPAVRSSPVKAIDLCGRTGLQAPQV